MNSKTLRIALPVALIALAIIIFGGVFFGQQEEKIEIQKEITPSSATPIEISEAKQVTETPVLPSSTATVENEVIVLPDASRAVENDTSKSPVPTPTSVLEADTPIPTFTPEPPTNTPALVSSPTSSPSKVSETPVSGEAKYPAEKISLEPVNLNVDLPGISVQGAEAPKINFGGWSNSGKQFAFAIPSPNIVLDPNAPEGSNTYTSAGLWIINLDGTGLQKITDQIGSLVLWSPDDSRIAYFKQNGVSSQEFWVVDLNTTIHTKLDEPIGIDINNTDYYNSIAWLDDKHLLYATYSVSGDRHLWVHNTQTNHIVEVVIDRTLDRLWSSIWLAPNKKTIVGNRISNGLWLGRLVETDGYFELEYQKDIINKSSLIPYWSPDSAKLAIKSYSDFAEILHIFDLNSGKEVEIFFPHTVATVDWSPDSQSLIVSNYGAGTGMPNSIYVVNVDGSGLRKLEEIYFGHLKWSPDGQYLGIFLSDETSDNNPFGIIEVAVNQ